MSESNNELSEGGKKDLETWRQRLETSRQHLETWRQYTDPEAVEKRKKDSEIRRKDSQKRRKMQREQNKVAFNKRVAEDVHERERRQRGRDHPDNWSFLPKVICSHCQVKGKVQKYVPLPEDESLGRLVGQAIAASAGYYSTEEKLAAEEQKFKRELTSPNMRCKNCDVEWKA